MGIKTELFRNAVNLRSPTVDAWDLEESLQGRVTPPAGGVPPGNESGETTPKTTKTTRAIR